MDNTETKKPSDQKQEKAPVASQESSGAIQGSTVPASGRSVFTDLGRKLSQEDLKNPGVQKLLLHMIEESDVRCEDFKKIESQFHVADKKVCALEEKLKTSRAVEIFYTVMLTVGSVYLGAGISNGKDGTTEFWMGICLMVGAILARMIKG